MQRSSKRASLALGLSLFLAACSSGLEQKLNVQEPEIETQANGTLWTKIGASNRDAEELTTSGAVTINATKLDLGYDTGASQSTVVGLNFPDLPIPAGATITAATLYFVPSQATGGVASLRVYAHDADNSSAFTTASSSVSNRALTTAMVNWDVPAWTTSMDYGSPEVASPNMKAVVQEVVDRAGWQQDNALTFIVKGSWIRAAKSWDTSGSDTQAPALWLAWTTDDEPTDPELTMWVNRYKYSINYYKNPANGVNGDLDMDAHAASNDTYRIGRELGPHINLLAYAFRKTGDTFFTDEISRLMQIARGKLSDPDGDGFDNWLYFSYKTGVAACKTKLGTIEGDKYCGKDFQQMDEQLAHDVVAIAAYTLKQDPDHIAEATFWTNYLKNDFEAKWRSSKPGRSGIQDVNRVDWIGNNNLTHPYTQFILYFNYMYKLTGQSSYLNNVTTQLNLAKPAFDTYPASTGTATVWRHSVNPTQKGCALNYYAAVTVDAIYDLHAAGISYFNSTFMQQVARNVAYLQIYDTGATPKLHSGSCGNITYPEEDARYIANFTNTSGLGLQRKNVLLVSKWDGSGRIKQVAENLYALTTKVNNDPDQPRDPIMTGLMVNIQD